MIDKTKGGLRAVSVFEAVKGLLALLFTLFLHTLGNRDMSAALGGLEVRWHIDVSRHISWLLTVLLHYLSGARLEMLMLLIAVYACMRFIEAYGLWFGRRWAEWFALLSVLVYLPVTLYELARGFSWVKTAFFIADLFIVFYISLELRRSGTVKKG